MQKKQIIVIGGGLSGLSAAHTAMQNGYPVVLLERNAFCGGNSTKATSGINGALTKVQKSQNINDSVEAFLKDTAVSSSKGKSEVPHPLAKTLVEKSAPAVHWLIDEFGLDLSILGRLGGHSFQRTHRGKKRFPGMEITYTLMKKYEEITRSPNSKGRLLTKCRATSLIKDGNEVIGVEYTDAKKQQKKEYGAVIIATGGFGADFSQKGILAQVRPDLLHLPTTNGPHCTGDGIKMADSAGAGRMDIAHVQVHPTGLVNPADPGAKTLYLAAEALRGCGALLIDREGNRFADELGRRDYVSGEMFKRDKAPYRLLLNSRASDEISWHCKHYTSRGLMKRYETGGDLAKDLGVTVAKLMDTFETYNKQANQKKDPFGKKFFANTPFQIGDYFYVAIVTPVIHYCMGGISVATDAAVLDTAGKKIPGLFASGEVMGGVHGENRLGGSSLLDCVVYGRIAGDSAAAHLNQPLAAGKPLAESSGGENLNNRDNASGKKLRVYSIEEVAKHNKDDDCWVVVNGVVIDVTSFLDDHPGGKDATEEFNMLHEPDVVEKYAPETIIGRLDKPQPVSKL